MPMVRMLCRCVPTLAAGLSVLGAVVGPQQAATFRSATKTVPVYVTVTDGEGRLVPDLSRDDFEIFDNGTLQPISVFAADIQPITVVMMLDRSGSMVENFRLVREAAEEFVTRLLPDDKARIGSFSNRVQIDPRTFTGDRDELLEILRSQLQEAGPTPLWNAVSAGMNALFSQQGRRVVLVFTDGADAPGVNRTNNQTFESVSRRAREQDVMVYAVGLAGTGGYRGRSAHGMPGGRGMYGRSGRPSQGGRLQQPDPNLARLAAESGGGYFELDSAGNLGATFARVADELHRQYALGFVPETLDDKTHRLEVRLKREGLTARTRQSYVARR